MFLLIFLILCLSNHLLLFLASGGEDWLRSVSLAVTGAAFTALHDEHMKMYSGKIHIQSQSDNIQHVVL
jgi:hypothetical protein